MQENTFRERLIEEMHSKNFTQVELCEKTKIPKSAMSQYVNGKITPKTDRLYLLAKALDVNPTWLMGLNVPKSTFKNSSAYYNPNINDYEEALEKYKSQCKIEMIEMIEDIIDELSDSEINRLSAYIDYVKLKRINEERDTIEIDITDDFSK